MPVILGNFFPLILILAFLTSSTPAQAQQHDAQKKQRKTHIELSLDTVMQQIDDMQQTLTRITTFREKDLDTAHLRDQLTDLSKLTTEEGTEVIMPNGDLISGEVVEDALKDHPDLSKSDPPRILLNTSNDKTISFTVMAWVENFGQIQTIKSEVLRLPIKKLREKNIKPV